jgi:bifunctional non-homologous end joining protein LigD
MAKKIRAMNAYMGTLDDLKNPDFIFEPKLDGIRALCYVNAKCDFISRNDLDLTDKYPELDVRKFIKAKTCILDGEIVAYDKKGIPHFSTLQKGGLATYVVFDILMKNGKSLVDLPLIERKKILDETVIENARIEKSFFTKSGPALWKEMVKKRMEGVMAKEANAPYHPGIRSGVWLKIKLLNTIDCVIVGFTAAKRTISSLALGLYDTDHQLYYVGKVGTGFNEKDLEELEKKLTPIVTDKRPTVNPPILGAKKIKWVKPSFVCEVTFLQFTSIRYLRASVFIRLRTDKNPKQCTFKSQMLLHK